jgi:hypothetical protein
LGTPAPSRHRRPWEKVGHFVFDAATSGKVVGCQGKGTVRPIYEFMFESRPGRK